MLRGAAVELSDGLDGSGSVDDAAFDLLTATERRKVSWRKKEVQKAVSRAAKC